ncbi:FRIGIDA-like protein 3 isoform X1 [Brachypodium distachyon]|uniref:FRIGIDA-like protein 3 isoform X1 n=1 Tax=Brachypodium distachyon TaxID=15368 RepID=UPI00071D9AEA|nr:FRIGIDA-like protein 3 isoform X1 [Brachypodium distachyon]|eukprot:XP_014757930.1 FRIGIDA-like protein 3 isoform X1 [Brachypodium distachyon]
MSDMESVATLMESTSLKIQQLQRAFAELESQSAVSMNFKWKQLEDHFHGLEQSLKKKFDELNKQEKEFQETVAKSEQILEQQEAVVVGKELTSLERLQEKRDAALAVIFGKSKLSLAAPVINQMNKPLSNYSPTLAVKWSKHCPENNVHMQDSSASLKPRSELAILCEEMNVKGLHKFISDNRKNLTSIREEIPSALKRASHPYVLVLDSLEYFYYGDNLVLDGKKDGDLLGVRRTCLMLMESLVQLQADAVTGLLSEEQMCTPNVKERAKRIAFEWKSKLDSLDVDASNGNCLEAHAFLQLLATFGIFAEFNEDELCKLLPSVSRRRQTPELCRLLGLSQKMPGVLKAGRCSSSKQNDLLSPPPKVFSDIQICHFTFAVTSVIGVLVDSAKPIDAINLAYVFGLTEQFEPVQLLKAYLREVRKVSHAKNGKMSPGAQNEMNERELSALKAVIKCIEEHKLEEQYPVDPLQKRVIQLEKAKADKRRAVEAAKPQSKRPRANGSVYAPRVTSFGDKNIYQATPERHPYPYERQFVYSAEAHHHPTMINAAPYTMTPAHTPYYGNGYPMQFQVPYIH